MQNAKRLLLLISAQGLSSVTNLLSAVAIARQSTAEEFGRFAVALVIYSVCLGLWKSVLGEDLLTATHVDLGVARRQHANYLGVSAVLALAVGTGVALCGVTFESEPMVLLGIALPALLSQELLRYVGFARHRPSQVLALDALWLVFLVAGLSVAQLYGGGASGLLVWGCWLAAGALSLFVGLAVFRLWPRVRPQAFRQPEWSVGLGYGAEYATGSGVGQLVVAISGVVGSVSSVGAIRGSQTLLGPLSVVFSGALTWMTLRAREASPSARGRLLVRMGLALSLAPVAVGLLLLVLPNEAGELVLGDTWETARKVGAVLCVGMIPQAFVQAATAGFRSGRLSRAGSVSRLICAPMVCVLGCGGALVGDAVGTAWGLALGNLLTAGIYWWRFLSRPD